MPDSHAISHARLSLLRLTSAALPIGAFSLSEGLEYAVEAGWVSDEDALREWLRGRLQHGITFLDLPLLARFARAWAIGDAAARESWGDFLRASRETSELWLQEHALGSALARLLADLGVERAVGLAARPGTSYLETFALAADDWRIALPDAAEGYVFAWLEAQVAAAIKLVPLGQTAGQRVLGALLPEVAASVETGLALADDEVGASEPGLAIASALHETQYSRLFRS